MFEKFIKTLFKLGKRSELIVSEKSRIRKEATESKSQLSAEEIQRESSIVFGKIESLPEFINAKTILMYWSLNDEFPTHDFIEKWKDSKSILLPVVKEGNLIIRKFTGIANLKAGNWGVLEPVEETNIYEDINLAIIPGVAFDYQCRRIGRGKGYYDRFLKHKGLIKLGIAFDCQIFPSIPTASFDIKMDKVISASYSL